MRTRAFGALLVLGLTATACVAGGGGSPGAVLHLRSEVERETPPPGAGTSAVGGDTEFALDLYRELAADEPEANLIFSPYSITVALAMTMAGARGETWDEMATMLRADTGEGWHASRNVLDQRLLRDRHTLLDREPLTLEIANSLWGQSDYPFDQEFLDLIARHYGSGLISVDFGTDPDGARRAINQWVEDATNSRIVNLLPDGSIDSLTRLVLVNAIWFYADWIAPFKEEMTENGEFTTASGSGVEVPLMHGSMGGEIAGGGTWTAARLPYAGDASMLVILPDEGQFTEVAAAISPELLTGIRSRLEHRDIAVTMPRFEFTSDIELYPFLSSLGMRQAFSPDEADLSGIADGEQLYIGLVQHQAFVSVDESGTEAAAATGVVVRGISGGPPPATLVLDRPFIFLIEDDHTGAILFIGQVTDPS